MIKNETNKHLEILDYILLLSAHWNRRFN